MIVKSLTSLSLISFKTEGASDISFMFYGCSSLDELDISSFNTGKCSNYKSIFDECKHNMTLKINPNNCNNIYSIIPEYINIVNITFHY